MNTLTVAWGLRNLGPAAWVGWDRPEMWEGGGSLESYVEMSNDIMVGKWWAGIGGKRGNHVAAC